MDLPLPSGQKEIRVHPLYLVHNVVRLDGERRAGQLGALLVDRGPERRGGS